MNRAEDFFHVGVKHLATFSRFLFKVVDLSTVRVLPFSLLSCHGETRSVNHVIHGIMISKLTLEWQADLWPNIWCAFTQRSVPFYAYVTDLAATEDSDFSPFVVNTNRYIYRCRGRDIYTITWISWILLNPSLQKNSIRLDKVLGPGISFRVLNVVFSSTSVGVTSVSGMASSLAAEIPKLSLAADLCKLRKTKNICLLSRSPGKLLQHAVDSLFTIAIVCDTWRWLREQRRCMIEYGAAFIKEFKSPNACPRHVQGTALPLCGNVMLD